MIKGAKEFLAELRGVNVKNLIIITLLCVVMLSSYYIYKKINSLEFLVENIQSEAKDSFFLEFGLEALQSDILIKEIIVSTRTRLNATQASM